VKRPLTYQEKESFLFQVPVALMIKEGRKRKSGKKAEESACERLWRHAAKGGEGKLQK